MGMKRRARKAAQQVELDPMEMLRGWGVRSTHAYLAGLVVLVLWAFTSIFMSSDSRRARLGAVLAPTLIGLGVGLEHGE